MQIDFLFFFPSDKQTNCRFLLVKNLGKPFQNANFKTMVLMFGTVIWHPIANYETLVFQEILMTKHSPPQCCHPVWANASINATHNPMLELYFGKWATLLIEFHSFLILSTHIHFINFLFLIRQNFFFIYYFHFFLSII